MHDSVNVLFSSKLSYWIGESQTDKTVLALRRSAKEGKCDLKAITRFDTTEGREEATHAQGAGKTIVLTGVELGESYFLSSSGNVRVCGNHSTLDG